ncbi:recombinase family protein [Polaromonas sp.]|uniref:recombinase family protein n=1 Tax=Polaromonas sp. TaxID=1869339 RepID=UPI003529E23D
MTKQTFCGYFRVSQQRQAESGLGLEAQETAVGGYLNGRGTLVERFTETESGRKGGKDRPELMRALAYCKRFGSALVVGKLDRLSRDVRFFLEVLDDYKVDIRFAEFPDINPKSDEGRMVLIGMANFAEFEGRRIGSRTKAALAAAKARGVVLGRAGKENLRPNTEQRQAEAKAFATRLKPVIDGFEAQGLTRREMVGALNALNIKAPRGGAFGLNTVQRLVTAIQQCASGECSPSR